MKTLKCPRVCVSTSPVSPDRLYYNGCKWGALLVVLWKAIAALEGLMATRRLGYGWRWLTLATARLALPLQARRCFHHSCESDLFQASFLPHVSLQYIGSCVPLFIVPDLFRATMRVLVFFSHVLLRAATRIIYTYIYIFSFNQSA